MAERAALEIMITAPVVSFRNPLYTSVQVCLPCPPPSTVGGMLAAAAGGWNEVSPGMRFAMAFRAGGKGVDLETYHPLDAAGKRSDPTPRNREFLADVSLTVWLLDDIEIWVRRLRRPVWPLRLGRSQDLVGVALRAVTLVDRPGQQRYGILPETGVPPAGGSPAGGMRLRLPTAVSLDRDRTRWDDYRYDPTGRSGALVDGSLSDPDRQAVVFLPTTQPEQA